MRIMVLKRRSDLTPEELRKIKAVISRLDQIAGDGGHESLPTGEAQVTSYRDGRPCELRFTGGIAIGWNAPKDSHTTLKIAETIRPLVRSGLLGHVDWATPAEPDSVPQAP